MLSLSYLPFPFLVLLQSVYAARQTTIPRPTDPFADPKNDPYNPLRYIASNTLTGIAVGLVLAVGLVQAACIVKYGTRFMLSMTIGCFTFATGLALRFGLHEQPESKGLYIAQYLFVVLSPCAFIAAEYVLIGRLARHLQADKYLLVNPRKITVTFITSDITTFLIQAIGGSVSLSSNSMHMNLVGSRVFLAGLALQLLSFLIFTVILVVFLWRVRTHEPQIWTRDGDMKWYRDWRTLALVMGISCIGVLVRSVYRVVELSEGYLGRLAQSEPFFYGLDTLPLFIAIAAYLPPFWPGMYIPAASSEVVTESKLDHEGSE